jgi:hypothetical protein
MSTLKPPTPRPCASCPYRRDVPPGIWASEEYAKLPPYDEPTPFQPTGVFQCHQRDFDADEANVCAGWAGCHDGDELLSLRIAAMDGTMTVEDVEAVRDYVSPVPLFSSGAEAAAHGLSVTAPNADGAKVIEKIRRARSDLR